MPLAPRKNEPELLFRPAGTTTGVGLRFGAARDRCRPDGGRETNMARVLDLDNASPMLDGMRRPANDPVSAVSCSPPRRDTLLEVAKAASFGDEDAIGTLFMEVGGSMLRTIRKVLGRDHPDVEDVAQDAFLALLSSLSTFRAECSVAHFASRVALLTALTARRRLRTRERFDDREASIESAPDHTSSTPLDRAISNRRRVLILDLLERLPAPTAEALAMHFVLGYTVDEIASVAGVPSNTVWSRLRLGKQALRRSLSDSSSSAELLRTRWP